MLSRGCLLVSFTFWDFGGWTCLGLLENAGPFTTLGSFCLSPHFVSVLYSHSRRYLVLVPLGRWGLVAGERGMYGRI